MGEGLADGRAEYMYGEGYSSAFKVCDKLLETALVRNEPGLARRDRSWQHQECQRAVTPFDRQCEWMFIVVGWHWGTVW